MNRIVPVAAVTALAVLMLTGCAAPVDWNARVGVYTYHQAVMDYGPPISRTTLKDGSTVAKWMTKRGSVVAPPGPFVYGQGFYYRRGNYNGPNWTGYSTTYSPSWFLRLEFGADGRLKAWKEYSK